MGELYLVNRTPSKAEQVLHDVRQRFPEVQVRAGYPPHEVDLMLNATSLGLKSDDSLPLDERAYPLRNARAVYDMIYRPAQTRLLQRAAAEGCRVANGLGMLLYQGGARWRSGRTARRPLRSCAAPSRRMFMAGSIDSRFTSPSGRRADRLLTPVSTLSAYV